MLTRWTGRGVVARMANPKAAAAIRVRLTDIRDATHPIDALAWYVDGEEGMRLGEKKMVSRTAARTAMAQAAREGNAAQATYLAVELAADDVAGRDSSATRDASGAWLWPGRTADVRKRIVTLANEMLASVKL